jgi:glycosyltransferase involved in cell wall biosynthesis
MPNPTVDNSRIAVLVPCYQEEKTIGKVIADFQRVLPGSPIYVYDNNCTDATARIARAAGAIVRREKRQGKGFVVASMFEQVQADVMVMVDGDGTYDPNSVQLLLDPILKGDADMTVAGRLVTFEKTSFRNFHQFGNRLVCAIINRVFHAQITDIFSGYRAFTREAAGRIPISSRGFDVETELTLQALYRGLVIKEVQAPYGSRPEGSFSKLRTFSDGFAVLMKLFLMLKAYKPLTFFGSVCLVLMVLSLLVGIRPITQFFSNGHVASMASAILASSLGILSMLSLGIGLILNSINLRLLEVEKLLILRPGERITPADKP